MTALHIFLFLICICCTTAVTAVKIDTKVINKPENIIFSIGVGDLKL